MRTIPLVLCCVATVLAVSPAPGQDTVSQIPNAKTLDTWVSFIRPSEAELAYEKIGWRNKFWPAVEEARKLGRPILLWTMNGHPLGCT